MPVDLLLIFLGFAIVDSVNPSAFLASGFILAKSVEMDRLKNLTAYVLGIVVSYFLIGLLILVSVDSFMAAAEEIKTSRSALIVQAIIGGALLLYAILAPDKPNAKRQAKQEAFLRKALQPRLLFFYGMQITIVELMSALPYFAALTLLANIHLSLAVSALYVAAYCLVFVLPLLIIAYVYKRKRERFDAWLKNRSERGGKAGRETLLWLLGIIGFVAFTQALSQLLR